MVPVPAFDDFEAFTVQDRVVAEHPRDWEKENVHYDLVHYLALNE